MQLAKMTGIMMGVHAIKDAFLLMHTGVGCKYKTAAQISQHDWASHPNKKEGWTQVGDRAVIKGSSGRIGPFARSWYERRNPGFMAVTTAVFLELTGEDYSDAVRRTEEDDFPCPMAIIGTGGATGDFFTGYAAMLLEVAKKIDWEAQEIRPNEVAIMGHLFTRYEADQKADVTQLKVLLKAMGKELGPVFFSGCPYEKLTHAAGSEHILAFPYAKKTKRKIGKLVKPRPMTDVDLPIGIAGTSRWMREVAEATGADQARVEDYIAKQTRGVKKQIAKLRDRIAGTPVAVFAETPLAVGLVTLLTEFGLRPMIIGLRDATLGQEAAFLEGLEKNGIQLPDGAEVLSRPSLRNLRERLMNGVEQNQIYGVFGSSTELNLFRSMPRLGGRLPFMIEVGFPSTKHHVTYAIPMFGYNGVVAQAQRVLDKMLAEMHR